VTTKRHPVSWGARGGRGARYVGCMAVDVESLMHEVQRRRQLLVVGTLGTLLLGIGTLFGPFLGSMVVSVTVSGSTWTGPPLVQLGLSDRELNALVGLGSLLVSGPLCLALLTGSWVWHRQVRQEAERAGIDHPALGIAAPARLVAWPVGLGVVLTLVLLPVPLILPTPEGSDILGNALAGGALLTPLLGPLVGLLVGWRRGVDAQGTARWKAGELTLQHLGDQPAAFPMIGRVPRSLRRVQLLVDAGELEQAEAHLLEYLRTVGVGLHRALLLLADVHLAAGRTARAEHALASAARLVPVDVTPLRRLAQLRRTQGHEAEAGRLEDFARALRGSLFGLARDRSGLGPPQRVQA